MTRRSVHVTVRVVVGRKATSKPLLVSLDDGDTLYVDLEPVLRRLGTNVEELLRWIPDDPELLPEIVQ